MVVVVVIAVVDGGSSTDKNDTGTVQCGFWESISCLGFQNGIQTAADVISPEGLSIWGTRLVC